MKVEVMVLFALGVLCLAIFLMALRDYKKRKDPKIDDGIVSKAGFWLALNIYPILSFLFFFLAIFFVVI